MRSNGHGQPILVVDHLQKTYVSKERSVEAIRDLDFVINQGELVCIVGPSGAGKTTLLRCLSGLLSVTSGAVVFEGKKVTSPPPGMAVVFQEYMRSLFPWLTVRQNIVLPLKEKASARPSASA